MRTKIVFAGTSEIAAFCLEKLFPNFDIVCILTKEDKLGNRNKLIYSPVKQFALKHNIFIYQPHKIIDSYDQLCLFKSCVLFVCSYGQIIPENILSIFKKSINLHASILPKFRGASPIQSAIKENEKETGYCLIEMVKELDAGPVYTCHSFSMDVRDTYDTVYQKMCSLIDNFLVDDLKSIISDVVKPVDQLDFNKNIPVSFTNLIRKESLFIKWNENTNVIDAFVRSLYSKPLARTRYENVSLKVLKTKKINKLFDKNIEPPGTILEISKEGILVKTLDGNILITELQLPNKNSMRISQIINGNHIFKIGNKFF